MELRVQHIPQELQHIFKYRKIFVENFNDDDFLLGFSPFGISDDKALSLLCEWFENHLEHLHLSQKLLHKDIYQIHFNYGLNKLIIIEHDKETDRIGEIVEHDVNFDVIKSMVELLWHLDIILYDFISNTFPYANEENKENK